MAELFLPTLHTFAMNNIFTGSMGLLRFRAKPNVVMANPKEVDYAQSSIFVEYWHGLYCYEKKRNGGKRHLPHDGGRQKGNAKLADEQDLKERLPWRRGFAAAANRIFL